MRRSDRRPILLRAVDALEDGDVDYAAELLRVLVDDDQAKERNERCHCGRWPGQRWSCPNVRTCQERLVDAA